MGLPIELPSEREQRTRKMETMTLDEYRELMARSGGKSKMGNVRTEVDGFVFASGLEATRYGELKLLEQAGEVRELQLQFPFRLDVNGIHVCTYVADFVYVDAQGKQVVEDTKGMKTAVYRLKKKLMKAVFGIEIVEIKVNGK
jgi:hypothetical protein